MQRQKPVRWLLALGVAVLVIALAGPALARTQVIPGHRQKIQNNSHALGVSFGAAGATGFAYRYYFGNNFVQASLLPLVADQGDYLALLGGLQIAHYLLVWNNTTSRKLMPTTTALRATGGVSTFLLSQKEELGTNQGVVTRKENTLSAHAGVGFEMGAVMKHGFSISFDVMLTSIWEDYEFDSLVPMPYGALMYSW